MSTNSFDVRNVVAVLSLVLYQSILIKVKRQEIATQLEAIGISYTVIRAHYRLSSEKFDKMTNGLIESDLLGFPKLEDEGGSKDKIDEIKIKINEIQTMLKK
jgi:hypothetical protein